MPFAVETCAATVTAVNVNHCLYSRWNGQLIDLPCQTLPYPRLEHQFFNQCLFFRVGPSFISKDQANEATTNHTRRHLVIIAPTSAVMTRRRFGSAWHNHCGRQWTLFGHVEHYWPDVYFAHFHNLSQTIDLLYTESYRLHSHCEWTSWQKARRLPARAVLFVLWIYRASRDIIA
jgi:hypothetical protein